MPQPLSLTSKNTYFQKCISEVITLGVDQAARDTDQARALAQRFGGVDHQVHQHLPHLRGVSVDRRQVIGQVQTEGRAFADREPQQRRRLPRQLAHVERAHHEAALARVSEQLPTQIRGADGYGLDLIDVLDERARGWQLEPHQADVAQNSSQQIVEVVRDAPGEDAQALQLLRVEQLAFELPAVTIGCHSLGHVPRKAS
jgi:hypothetical protein